VVAAQVTTSAGGLHDHLLAGDGARREGEPASG
jgi:hypothetical protein